jgi:hypothetical protein
MRHGTLSVERPEQMVHDLAVLAPFLREAKGKQQASEKRFWEKFGK